MRVPRSEEPKLRNPCSVACARESQVLKTRVLPKFGFARVCTAHFLWSSCRIHAAAFNSGSPAASFRRPLSSARIVRALQELQQAGKLGKTIEGKFPSGTSGVFAARSLVQPGGGYRC